MGMGHVPSGPVPGARKGSDLPRRQRRRAGEGGDLSLDRRPGVGSSGERIAAWFLNEAGLRVIARNVTVSGGEIDLVAMDGSARVVIEVRTVTGDRDPVDAIGDDKRSHVEDLGRRAGARRVDFVGVGLTPTGVDVHWLPGEK